MSFHNIHGLGWCNLRRSNSSSFLLHVVGNVIETWLPGRLPAVSVLSWNPLEAFWNLSLIKVYGHESPADIAATSLVIPHPHSPVLT